jgi:hypothetical protein
MERTKQPKKGNPDPNARMQVLSALMGRANIAARLGMQFDGSRDIYEALGYKKELTYLDFLTQYSRQDMAKALINRPIKGTWQGDLIVLESDDDKETELERAWKDLEKRLKLKSRFVRLDKLSSLGRYGVLLMGFNDVRAKDDLAKPVEGGKRDLIYVKPFGEGSCSIQKWEDDPNNERFGLPLIYELRMTNPGDSKTYNMVVHHSRVIHVVGELLENETEGEPVLEVLFNRLKDLEKLVGGSAEMFWKGARPGYQGVVDSEYTMSDEMEQDLKNQLDEYEHNLRRVLLSEGVDLKTLASQVSDPLNHVDVQIQMISAATGIPKRILVGSERGELASSQDQDTWKELIQTRREEFAEQQILLPFIDRCIELGVLPKAGADGYSIKWSDLFAPSEKDQVDIGKARTEALRSYAQEMGAAEIIPPVAFMEFFLGLSPEQIQMIQEMREAALLEEEAEWEEEKRLAEEAEKRAQDDPIPPDDILDPDQDDRQPEARKRSQNRQ